MNYTVNYCDTQYWIGTTYLDDKQITHDKHLMEKQCGWKLNTMEKKYELEMISSIFAIDSKSREKVKKQGRKIMQVKFDYSWMIGLGLWNEWKEMEKMGIEWMEGWWEVNEWEENGKYNEWVEKKTCHFWVMVKSDNRDTRWHLNLHLSTILYKPVYKHHWHVSE